MEKLTMKWKEKEIMGITYPYITIADLSQKHFFFEMTDIKNISNIKDMHGKIVSTPHCHDFYTILICYTGSGEFQIGRQYQEVRSGRIFLLSPWQLHCTDKINAFTGVAISFYENAFFTEQPMPMCYVRHKIFNVFEEDTYCQIDNMSIENEITAVINALHKEYRHPEIAHHYEFIKHLLWILITNMIRSGTWHRRIDIDNDYEAYKLYVDFKDLVWLHYMHEHKVEWYIQELKITKRRLNSCVKKFSGMTPLALIHSTLLFGAQSLLQYSSYTVKDIAIILGFCDTAHFDHFIMKEVGTIPYILRDKLTAKEFR